MRALYKQQYKCNENLSLHVVMSWDPGRFRLILVVLSESDCLLLCAVLSALEGSLRSGDAGLAPHYLSRLNCSSCGTPSPQHSEVCASSASRSRLTEDMTEMHSEYSDSSCGECGRAPQLWLGRVSGSQLNLCVLSVWSRKRDVLL